MIPIRFPSKPRGFVKSFKDFIISSRTGEAYYGTFAVFYETFGFDEKSCSYYILLQNVFLYFMELRDSFRGNDSSTSHIVSMFKIFQLSLIVSFSMSIDEEAF